MQIGKVTRSFIFSIALFLAMPVSVYAATVIVDGKEWRQVTETVNTSWNTLAASCDTDTGACGGAYDGWTWASKEDLSSLFTFVIQQPFNGYNFYQFNSTWATAFTPASFTPTYSYPSSGQYEVYGWTRTKYSDESSWLGYVINYGPGSSSADVLGFYYSDLLDLATPGLGAWMYKAAAPIPEPEIYAMMGLGLGLLGWVGQRRKLAA